MSEDLTKRLPQSDSEKLTLVLTIVQSLTVRVDNIDSRLNNMDSRFQEGQRKLEEGQRKLEEGQRKLEEGQSKLEEGQLNLQSTVLQLQDGQRELKEGQEIIAGELYKLSRDVSHRFLALSGATNAEIRNLKKRVTSLEQNVNPPKHET